MLLFDKSWCKRMTLILLPIGSLQKFYLRHQLCRLRFGLAIYVDMMPGPWTCVQSTATTTFATCILGLPPARSRVQDAVWQSAKCKLTLPALDKWLLARSAKEHFKQCMPKAKLTPRQNQQRLRKGHTAQDSFFQNLSKAARLAQMRRLDGNINEASTATGHKLQKIMFLAMTWKSDVTITCQTRTRFFRCLKEARDCKQCPGVDGSHGRNRKWLRKGNWWTLACMKHIAADLHQVLQAWKPTTVCCQKVPASDHQFVGKVPS